MSCSELLLFSVLFIYYVLCCYAHCPILYESHSSLNSHRKELLTSEYCGNAARKDIAKSRHIRETTSTDDYFEQRSFCSPEDEQPLNRINTFLRVKRLRQRMLAHSFDALIIPSSDEHQNEYVAPSDKRREFITGFTGSAGTAVISLRDQVMWTDSRYTLQADFELDCNWKLVTQSHSTVSESEWLAKQLEGGSKIGGDMRLFGAEEWKEAEKLFNASNLEFADSGPLFDDVWDTFGRPSSGNGSLFVHHLYFAATSWQVKVDEIRNKLKESEADLFVVTALDEVAWLLNLRGFDIPYNPVFRSYLLLEAKNDSKIHLFLVNPTQVPEEVMKHLGINNCTEIGKCIEIHSYDSIHNFVKEISKREDIKKVLLSRPHPYSQGVSYYIYSAVPEEKRLLFESPIMLRKARKEGHEATSMKEAQVKDSVALVEFFSFLEKEIQKGSVWDELSVQAPLRYFRSQQKYYRGESFQAISGFGENSAIAHYTPSNITKQVITDQSLYMLDSGGQYLDGTTDVTRTLHYGTPTPFQKEAYTRVLQGFIDLATLVFPWGMRDIFIDVLARRPLYESGLTYGHGSGHGIGLYLGIHEGPTLLSMSTRRSSLIEVGQFFSDEPGYYKKGDFGIRLESILHVIYHPTLVEESGDRMMQFEVVTLVPFESKLIDESMLTIKQCKFLNDYNTRVREVVGKRLLEKEKEETHEWLMSKTNSFNCVDHAVAGGCAPEVKIGLIITLISILFCKYIVIL